MIDIRKFLVLALLIFVKSALATDLIKVKVSRVIDGNTIEVVTAEDDIITVKLKDVDSPELGQKFAEEARSFTKRKLQNREVYVRILGKDRWGNHVATVQLSKSKTLSHELLRQGLAWRDYRCNDESLAIIEENARASKEGLWEEESPTPPWVFRRKQTSTMAKYN